MSETRVVNVSKATREGIELACAQFGQVRLADQFINTGASPTQTLEALAVLFPHHKAAHALRRAKARPPAPPPAPPATPQPPSAAMQERAWASEVIGLCRVAGMPAAAITLLKHRATIARVREYLVNARAALSDSHGEIDPTPPGPIDPVMAARASWDSVVAKVNQANGFARKP